MLASTAVLGLSATVAILQLTSTEASELTLPVARPEDAEALSTLSSEPTPPPTPPAPSSTAQAQPGSGEPGPTAVTSTPRPAPHYRWQLIAGVADMVGRDARSGLSAVALVEGQGLIAVGTAGSGPLVLVSADGRGWTRVTDAEPSLDGAVLRDVAVVGERLVAVGSLRGEPAAWTSGDGLDWTTIPVAMPAGARPLGLLDGIAVSPEGAVVAVGFAAGSSGIWTLHEGAFAAVRGLRPLPARGQVLSDVAATTRGLVAGGNDADGRPVIWRSEDAAAWIRSDLPADPRGASVAAVGEVAGGLVAVGYDGQGARMWTATDDDRWTDVATPPPMPDGRPQALWAVATGTSGGLAGGQAPGGPLCWASGDGAAWVDCHADGDLVVATARDLVATPDGFVAVGSATDARSAAGPAIWRVEQDNQAPLAR